MKIGILGGSFNPVHIGHLALAEYVRQDLSLDKVIFVPCNITAHKNKLGLVNPEDRLAMLKLAIAGNQYFQASDIEIKRGGVSYTIDTLAFFKERYKEAQLFFIIGSDLYDKFDTWKRSENITKIAKVVVINRTSSVYKKQTGFIYKQMPMIELSSSSIRKLLLSKKSIKYLVPDQVEKYIKKYNLYV